jgi:hypothetical protein
MSDNETMDCATAQWHTELKRQHQTGELQILVRTDQGEVFRLGELPDTRSTTTHNIIHMGGVFSEKISS